MNLTQAQKEKLNAELDRWVESHREDLRRQSQWGFDWNYCTYGYCTGGQRLDP